MYAYVDLVQDAAKCLNDYSLVNINVRDRDMVD